MADSKRLVVLGSGPGGYAAAFAAADHGLQVTLISDDEHPGGVCLYRGCIPSKALLHVAKLLHEAKMARAWGIDFGTPRIDLDGLRAWKDSVVAKLTGGLGQLAKARRVTYVRGRGKLLDAQHVQVELTAGGQEVLEFDVAILATGSQPLLPGAFPQHPRVMDSTAALTLPDIPERLLVVGGGYIGLELSTAYAALGSHVTVVEAGQEIARGADRDLVDVLAKRLYAICDEILLDTKVLAMQADERGVTVQLAGLDLAEPERRFDKALVAIGRRPNSQGLGLEQTAVELDPQGFVVVDAQRRTAEPSLYAIGDLAGQPMLAHKARFEARVAVAAILGEPSEYDPAAIPAVVFTDPELAWCGLTETEAATRGRDIKVTRFPWAASGRAATIGREDGLTKIIVDTHNERVLGVGIAGPGAGELIAEAVLAVEMGARADDLTMSIHAHPTLSETVMESAEMFAGQSAHFLQRQR
ncbi:MAG: dihydrolipoyl dehydrogenase [Fimbriimonadaceae bacterium]|nr:dihydrolipoyl dehydrogenase [Fimbriimonadaceae bacterium]